MIRTSTFSADNIGEPEPVIADVACWKITINEVGATTDYRVYGVIRGKNPTQRDTVGVIRSAGIETIFEARGVPFEKGEVVGWVETLIGVETFQKRMEL